MSNKMTKHMCLMLSLLCCMLLGCSKEGDNSIAPDVIEHFSATILPVEGELSDVSRINFDGHKITWAPGDTLGIFPNKGGQVEFPITSGFETNRSEFNGGGWGLKTGFKYASYFPYNHGNRDPKKIPLSYSGQVQIGSNTLTHLKNFIFLAAKPAEATGSFVNFEFGNMGAFMRLTLTMEEAHKYTQLRIFDENKSKIFPIDRTINLLDPNLTISDVNYSDNITLGLENIATTKPDNLKFIVWISVPAMSEVGKNLKVAVIDEQGSVYIDNIVNAKDNLPTDAVFKQNRARNVKASPKLQGNVNIGIDGWL